MVIILTLLSVFAFGFLALQSIGAVATRKRVSGPWWKLRLLMCWGLLWVGKSWFLESPSGERFFSFSPLNRSMWIFFLAAFLCYLFFIYWLRQFPDIDDLEKKMEELGKDPEAS
ncbi:MAG: hypothetical protein AAFR61_25995 [Bacteroidota bacterium]